MWIADAHLDLAYELHKLREYGESSKLEDYYLPRWRHLGVGLIVSSFFLDNRDLPESGLRRCLLQCATLLEEIEAVEGIRLIKSRQDLQKARTLGEIGILLSFEGVDPLGEDDLLLEIFKKLGLKGIGLVWSRRNAAGEGSPLGHDVKEKKAGLGDLSYRLFTRAKGLYVDLAHMNEVGFWETLENYHGPIMVSHSNARSLCNTPRNLSDRQIRAVFERGGFIGVNAMNFTVSDGSKDDMDGYIDHLIHMLDLGGENCLGFGFDFNDRLLRFVPPGQLRLLPRQPKDCIGGHEEVPALLKRMEERGISSLLCNKIAGDNLYYFLDRSLDSEEK